MAALNRAPVLGHEYLIEEDEMGDSTAQTRLLGYLEQVLRQLLDGWFVARNLTFYHPAIRNSQQMISPDIAVFLGIQLTRVEQDRLTSWDMRSTGGDEPRACPPLVIEVSSTSTWRTDIGRGPDDKVLLYGQMGVREYLAYDPNEPPVWRPRQGRLLGWRYDGHGRPMPLEADERGWLWSEELESWLAADGSILRLYDQGGVRRLTSEETERAGREAERAGRQAAEEQAKAEREARQISEERLAAALRILDEHNLDLP